MMTINVNTKIASLLKHNTDALEAIVSLSPKFAKLRNPILRKVIAGRTSIAMASKIGGCSVDDFFDKLQPFGFEMEKGDVVMKKETENNHVPAFMKNMDADKMVTLDVRPVIDAGKDPLEIIVNKVNVLEAGCVLKIINSFEPTPLMHLLGKKGFESYAETIDDDIVHTYFYKSSNVNVVVENKPCGSPKGWDEIMNRFKDKLETIDVRALEMPLPMHTILEALTTLANDKALFIYHKRIPVFLLPELEEQHFSYRIKEISDAEVHVLIFKN